MRTDRTQRTRIRSRAHARGYTLVEMLVVVTMLGIIGAMIIPSLSQTHVIRVQAAVRAVVSDVAFAQADALAYQQGRAVIFDTIANSYTLCEVRGAVIDPVADALYNQRGVGQRYTITLDEERFGGARLDSPDFNGGDILIFDELGGPVPAPGSGELSDGGSIDIIGPGLRYRVDVRAFTGRLVVTREEG
ncbi:MAG: type II secretion system protein [Planctomycetota bacterium]